MFKNRSTFHLNFQEIKGEAGTTIFGGALIWFILLSTYYFFCYSLLVSKYLWLHTSWQTKLSLEVIQLGFPTFSRVLPVVEKNMIKMQGRNIKTSRLYFHSHWEISFDSKRVLHDVLTVPVCPSYSWVSGAAQNGVQCKSALFFSVIKPYQWSLWNLSLSKLSSFPAHMKNASRKGKFHCGKWQPTSLQLHICTVQINGLSFFFSH